MNNLTKVVTQRCLEQDLNPRPTDRKPKMPYPLHRRAACVYVTIFNIRAGAYTRYSVAIRNTLFVVLVAVCRPVIKFDFI